MQKSKYALSRATITIAFFSLLAKLSGLLRLNILTSNFKAGDTLDLFYAAFRVPDFIYNLLILGTLSVAFIPVFCEYIEKDRVTARKLATSVFNLTLVVMGALSVLLIIFAPIFVSLVVPGFSADKQVDTVLLTRIMALSPLLFSLSSVFSSVLNSFKRFAIVAAAPIIYNLGIMFGALVLYPHMGIAGLGWGVVIGAFLHMSMQIPSAVSLGFSWKPKIDIQLPALRQVARLFVPRVFGMDASQISLLVSTIIGSSLASGSITYYSLAYDIQSLPLGILAVSFAVAAFPTLSSAFAQKDSESFKEVFNITLSQILYVMIPLSSLMLILRAQIVRLILGRGEFGWDATVFTISAFAFFVLSLFGQALIPLLSRTFYAAQNTVIPVVASLVAGAVNIVGAFVLAPKYGVQGLAIAFSLAALTNLIVLFVSLEWKFGNLVSSDLVLRLEKILISTLVSAVAAYATLYLAAEVVDTRTFLGLAAQGLLSGLIGISAYLLAGYILRVPETRHLIVTSRLFLNKMRSAFSRMPGGI